MSLCNLQFRKIKQAIKYLNRHALNVLVTITEQPNKVSSRVFPSNPFRLTIQASMNFKFFTGNDERKSTKQINSKSLSCVIYINDTISDKFIHVS